jgi:hypothetical protein
MVFVTGVFTLLANGVFLIGIALAIIVIHLVIHFPAFENFAIDFDELLDFI